MAYKYNPKKMNGSFVGTVDGRDFAIPFVGYFDGSHIVAEFDEDAVTKHVGNQGEVTIVLNANQSARITVVLSMGSPTNDELSDLVPDARRDYLPVGTLNFEDLNGTTTIKAMEAWIVKKPKLEYSKEATGREWMFDTGQDTEIHIGGAEL